MREQEKIFLPSQFTYWCHSSNYSTSGTPQKKVWPNLPVDEVVVRGELSLLSRGQRLQYAVEHHDLGEAPISYAPANEPSLRGFQMKVVMPKMDMTAAELKKVGKTDEQISRFNREKFGLGDNRHPKLSGGTQIHIFGYMNKDEMSKKAIDTVFGVRDEDLVWYANAVLDELKQRKEQNKTRIDPAILPKSREDANEEDRNRQSTIFGSKHIQIKNRRTKNEHETDKRANLSGHI